MNKIDIEGNAEVTSFEQNRSHRNVGKKNFSHGFTLIELIIVIVVLGILSAFALPRFTDLGTDARVATVDALMGSIRSASGIAHSIAVLENKTDCAADPTIEIEGETITLRCGYPCPHPNGIAKAVRTEGGYTWVGGNCGGQLGAIEVRVTDAPDPNNCKIRYTSARATRPPGFAPTTSGC